MGMRPFGDAPKWDGLPLCQTADAMVLPVNKAPEGRETGTGGMKVATESGMAGEAHCRTWTIGNPTRH